jgi:hypothetical protein
MTQIELVDKLHDNQFPMSSLPPTADDWLLLRPIITELYKAKQQTARQIVEGLRQQGWLIT